MALKLSRRTLLLLSLTAGCSGSGGVSTPTGVTFTLDWPDASRVLPRAAKSVRVRIQQGTKTLAERLYLAGADSEEQINGLPFATALTLEASAYASTDATGASLASASIPFSLFRGKQERLALTLASVITRVELSQTTVLGQTELTATGRDAAGSAVLTLPEQWQWSLSDPNLGTLTASGPTAQFADSGFGIATLTATEKESGKSASLVRPVCSGDPTKTAPQVGFFQPTEPIRDFLPLDGGMFAVIHGARLSGIDSTGALFWQRSLPFSDGVLNRRLLGRFLSVQSASARQARLYRQLDGAFLWSDSDTFRIGAGLADRGTLLLAYHDAATPPELQGRQWTDGMVLWSRAVPQGALSWADSSRILISNPTDSTFIALQSNLGTLLWESRVPEGSTFIGTHLTGATPLLFSLSSGELRASFLTNGVRHWSVSTFGDQATITPDQNQLLVFSRTQCSAYDPDTGSTIWSRSGLTDIIGMLPSGDLLVLPPAEFAGCQPLQALRPTDGTVRWTSYLPISTVAGDRFVARIGGTRIFVDLGDARGQGTSPLFAIDSSTGVYLWGTYQYGPAAFNPPPPTTSASGAVLGLILESGARLALLHGG